MDYNQGIFTLLPVALSITAPIFILISLGAWLFHIRFITDEFINVSSKFIFNIGLPIILFTSTAAHDFKHLINFSTIAIIVLTTLLVYFFSHLSAHKFIDTTADKGVFVQGSFRGNLVILGLAFCANAYPEQGVAIATIPTAVTIIMYNLLAIYTLNNSLHHQGASFKKNVVDIIKNPLIIAIMAGLLANLINIKTPDIIAQSNQYIAKMTLPLALIIVGGSLNFLHVKQNINVALVASIWKVILSPIILVGLLLTASPTATASLIMVKSMHGNSDLAAKIIILSTLMSLFTVTIGFVVLVSTNLIALQ